MAFELLIRYMVTWTIALVPTSLLHLEYCADELYQASYIFRPVKSGSTSVRPAKRRKTAGSLESHNEAADSLPFVPLLSGLEDDKLVKKRYGSFQEFWSKQAGHVDVNVLKDMSAYIESISTDGCNERIPTALINLGSNISSIGRLLNHLKRELHSRKIAKIVALESGDAVNLKTALKNIIRDATTELDGEAFSAAGNVRSEIKYLPYDLDALHEHLQRQGLKKVVIAFQDSEACDQSVLADLISLLSSWMDRIPFILLFGVATSIELFEGRLARAAANLLDGTRFDIQGCDDLIDRTFVALQLQPDNAVWLGPQVSSLLLEKSRDHFESPESFSYGMKVTLARRMLEDDKLLAEQVIRIVNQNRKRTFKALETAKVISHLLEKVGSSRRWTISELVIQALSGDLLGSKELEELLKTIKKQSSDKTLELLLALPQDVFQSFAVGIQRLHKRRKGDSPLRSEYDDRNQVHTTSVVGRRVQLNRGKARLTPLEMQYTRLIEQLAATLQEYFDETLIQEELFLHEAFICDLKMPLKRVLAPRPRFTVERALSSPVDYLVPQSGMSKRALASSQPAISIAYQLYLESGGMINVYDWWSTFYSIIGGKDGELCEERQAMALFYRALADLKMLGMIKNTKRKADHVAKVTWKGL
ncbi:hypothetical protein KEM54_003687 [Ascosphaera aggregata]|nr:hypothetical protein KEM54_003687 [Ascosphaera aggregata]